MGTWKTTIILAACGLALVGCKTQIATSVSLSELNNPEVKQVAGKIRLEVPGCNDYEDSRQPSDSLVKAQQMLPRIFPAAEFKECYTQQMNSWAEFTLPVAIDHTDDDKPTNANTFNLLTLEGTPLLLYVPQPLAHRFAQAKDANPMMGNLDLAVRVDVVNDTQEARTVQAFGVWVDGDPVVLDQFDLAPGSKTQLVLSDVTIDQAMKRQYATILRSP